MLLTSTEQDQLARLQDELKDVARQRDNAVTVARNLFAENFALRQEVVRLQCQIWVLLYGEPDSRT